MEHLDRPDQTKRTRNVMGAPNRGAADGGLGTVQRQKKQEEEWEDREGLSRVRPKPGNEGGKSNE